MDYIRNELLNPEAADALIDELETAVLERLPICDSFETYHSKHNRKYPYYRIYVKNYVVYYVVIEEAGKRLWKSDAFCINDRIGII